MATQSPSVELAIERAASRLLARHVYEEEPDVDDDAEREERRIEAAEREWERRTVR